MEEDDLGLKTALDKVTTQIQAKESSEPSSQAERDGWIKWVRLRDKIGPRYAECKLSNFQLSTEPKERDRQEKVIESLRAYALDMPERVKTGAGIILFGPAGTGKDHLLAALMAKACRWNLDVAWCNGMDLFAERRDRIDENRVERDMIRELVSPEILAISDPVPPWGNLTEGQAEFLFRVFDGRYRQCKPIWVTANFAEGKEAENRLGKQVVDRLRDGALALHCNWPSYRRASS